MVSLLYARFVARLTACYLTQPVKILLHSQQERVTAIQLSSTPLVTSKRTTRTGKATTKPRNTDIPEDMRDRWNTIFVPLARELVGTLKPWETLSVAQVQLIYQRAFPESNYIVTKGDIFSTIVSATVRLYSFF